MTNQPSYEMSTEDLQLNAEGVLLDVISRYGGERIVAGPVMDRMLKELVEAIIAPHELSFFQRLSERRRR